MDAGGRGRGVLSKRDQKLAAILGKMTAETMDKDRERNIGGVVVRITDPARTVADCFKYRNKIGLDVAIEAMRECVRKRRCTPDELWRSGKTCRVANVMRPYLEAMG